MNLIALAFFGTADFNLTNKDNFYTLLVKSEY
jgi:hypothetical protein